MRMYGGDYRVGPLSVPVDPLRALRVLGLVPHKPFSTKMLYVYGKQPAAGKRAGRHGRGRLDAASDGQAWRRSSAEARL